MKKWTKLLAVGLAMLLPFGCFTGCASDRLQETKSLQIYNLVNDNSGGISGFYTGVSYLYQMQYPEVDFIYSVSDLDSTALTWGNDITPEMGEVLQQYYDSVSVSIMKGECEDVIYADTFYQWFSDVTPPDYNKMIRAGAFMDLKPILEEIAPDLDLSVYDSLLIDGKLYAIPIYRQPYVIYSAENLLSEWEFDYNPQDDILTFLRKCADWQEQHANDEQVPVVFTKQAWDYIYYNIFNILGVAVVDYDAGTANFNDRQILECIALLKELQSDYDETMLGSMGDDPGVLYGQALFGRSGGAYDMIVVSAYGYNYLGDAVVMMPLLQLDQRAATASDTYLLVPDNAKNKLNAARYVALMLEQIVKRQKGDTDAVTMRGFHRNSLLGWDAGEAGVLDSLTNSKFQAIASATTQETVLNMYHNQGDIKMPSYWYHSLKYLFDDYMAGEISIDTLASDVQSRLEIYVTE